jgi:ubiquinone/menaquinone biosynthesis C-methylase UbiE
MIDKQLAAKFAKAVLPIFAFLAIACAHHQERMPPRSQDRPLADRINSFERPDRASWQKPDEVIQALEVKNGDMVADIGAGTGYFTRPFAKAVAPDGKVYAVDVAADILGYLQEQAEKEGLHNIVTIVSREEDPMLPKNTIDLAFFCDVTHHLTNRVNFYRAMAPGVKQHGRMAIIDYAPDAPRHPHTPEEHVPRSQAISEAEEAGFKFVKDFQFLPNQYFLVFEKQ